MTAARRKVKHLLYLCLQSVYYSHFGTPYSLQKSTLSLSRKKKTSIPLLSTLLFFSKFKSLLCPQRTHNPGQPIFLSSLSLCFSLLTNNSSLPVCLFNYFAHSFISSFFFLFAFYLFLPLTPAVSLSLSHAGYFSSRSQSSCD